LGAHTHEILAEVLGYSSDRISSLEEAGVLA